MKTALGIRHVTPEIMDRTINEFWDQARKLGPEEIAVLDGVEFGSLLAASKEWPTILMGLLREISESPSPQAQLKIAGALHITMRMGILIGLETAADPITQAAQLGFSIGLKNDKTSGYS